MEFQRVLRAFKILSDPAKREEYDRTGEIPTDAPDRTMQQVMEIIAQVFDAALGGMVNGGQNPTEHDLAEAMRELLRRRIKQIEEERRAPENILATLTALLGRFSVEEGENDLEALIVQQVDGVKKTLANMEGEQALQARALTFLKRYKYRHEKRATVTGGFGPFSGTFQIRMGS